MIRNGEKTVTRREWSKNYARPNAGSIQIASTEMFTKDEDADCYIRIRDVYDQPLAAMTDEDAQQEGDYETLEEFRDGYEDVYGEGAWEPAKIVAVVEFEYVGRERPREQTELRTDGRGKQAPEYEIQVHRAAQQSLLEADDNLLDRLQDTARTEQFTALPYVKRITEEHGYFRVRAGDYRAICYFKKPTIWVLLVGRRDGIYQRIDTAKSRAPVGEE